MKIRVSAKRIGYMLLIIPLIKPSSMVYWAPSLDLILSILAAISGAIILIQYLMKVRRIDWFLVATLAYAAILILSTVLNKGSVRVCFIQMAYILAFVLLVRLMLLKSVLFCLDVFLPVLEVLIYINLVTVILFPDGMFTVQLGKNFSVSSYFFLGMDNGQTPYYILAITVTMLRTYYLSGKTKLTLRNVLLISACVATVLICWQATAVVGLFLLLTFILFPRVYFNIKALNSWSYMLAAFVFFLLVVVFRIEDQLSFLIQDVLHKSTTLSGRTGVWDRALLYIAMRPWVGYGVQSNDFLWSSLNQIHAHNLYFEVLFQGGVFLFIPIVAVHLLATARLYENRDNLIAKFLAHVLFCMIVMSQVENNNGFVWFVLFQLAYESRNIIQQQKAMFECRQSVGERLGQPTMPVLRNE